MVSQLRKVGLDELVGKMVFTDEGDTGCDTLTKNISDEPLYLPHMIYAFS